VADPGCLGNDAVPIGGLAIGTNCASVIFEGDTCHAVCVDGLSAFGLFVCIAGQIRHTSYCRDSSTEVKTALEQKIAGTIMFVLPQRLREDILKRSLAVALGLQHENFQSIRWTSAASSTGGRLLTATYTVSYEAVLLGTDSIETVMRRATTIAARGSDTHRAFVSSMSSGGLEVSTMEQVVSPRSFKQTVVRTVDGAIIPIPSVTDEFDFNASNATLQNDTIAITTSTSTHATVQDDSVTAPELTTTTFAVEEINDASTNSSSMTDELDDSTALDLRVPCDSEPMDPNGMYLEADDYWPNGTWWLRCDEGYIHAGGQNMARCLATGFMRLAGPCQLSGCNGKQVLAHHHDGVAGTTCWEEMLEGEKCQHKCLDGWQSRGFFVCAWTQLLGSPLCVDRERDNWAMVFDVAKVSGTLEVYTEPVPFDPRRNDTALLRLGFASLLSIPVTDVASLNVTTSSSGHNDRPLSFGLGASIFSVHYGVWVEDASRVPKITLDLGEVDYANTKARRVFTLVMASVGYTVVDVSVTHLPWLSQDPRVRMYEEQSHADALVHSGKAICVFLSFAFAIFGNV